MFDFACMFSLSMTETFLISNVGRSAAASHDDDASASTSKKAKSWQIDEILVHSLIARTISEWFGASGGAAKGLAAIDILWAEEQPEEDSDSEEGRSSSSSSASRDFIVRVPAR
jgi:hypothetical protein